MSLEKPSSESEEAEFFVQGLETFPRLEFTPIAGFKRWLAERRQRKEELRNNPRHLLGPVAASLESPQGLPDAESEFHPNPSDPSYKYFYGLAEAGPTFLGPASENPAASAIDHAQKIKQQTNDRTDLPE